MNRAKFFVDRYAFLSVQIEGMTLDVGCQDGSGWAYGHTIIKKPFDYWNGNIYYFDMDKWSHPRFIRGDAHHLPFKNNSFDTVVSGDILEHVVNPVEFLRELIRISKEKVVITTPDEYQWHKDLYPFYKSSERPENKGMTEDEMAEKDTLHTYSLLTKCTEFVKESKMKHLYHIRQFTPLSFINLIQEVYRNNSLILSSMEINHLYHPLAPKTPDEPQDMAYWTCIFYKEN